MMKTFTQKIHTYIYIAIEIEKYFTFEYIFVTSCNDILTHTCTSYIIIGYSSSICSSSISYGIYFMYINFPFAICDFFDTSEIFLK